MRAVLPVACGEQRESGVVHDDSSDQPFENSLQMIPAYYICTAAHYTITVTIKDNSIIAVTVAVHCIRTAAIADHYTTTVTIADHYTTTVTIVAHCILHQ